MKLTDRRAEKSLTWKVCGPCAQRAGLSSTFGGSFLGAVTAPHRPQCQPSLSYLD